MRNRLYYLIKPLLPWRLRMTARRWHARRLRESSPQNWPILPSAGQAPESWPGWPDQKQLSVVLTHDVEGPEGVARVRRLAELEMSLGFRSSYNFIPEGRYPVPHELIAWLKKNGFEVGVHDLAHDGSLYRSREGFRQRAQKINQYLREWNAVGFRSGFMHHNLEWLHDLEITYDASTFDIDPFEPQPDGAGTIYPFWVAAPESGDANSPKSQQGYVELPYSIPQDSTLFLVLGESSPAIWLQKLAWVGEQGGMALINVHPDYLRFEDEADDGRTYPVDHYVQFLKAARGFGDRAWYALPRDLAHWYNSVRKSTAEVEPSPKPVAAPNGAKPTDSNSLAGRRVGVLLYSCYPSDSRPRRAAEALAAAGAQVELICLQEKTPAPYWETISGVQVTRVPLRQRRGGKLTYAFQYGMFFAWCAGLLTKRSLSRRYDVIHAHNMPDFLVLASWIPRCLGARVILDLHDPMPELFMSLYRRDSDDWLIRLLCWMERHCIHFSHLVLTPNEAFRQRFVSRSGSFSKVQVVMNTPEESIFDPVAFPAPASRAPGFRLMYHGLIAERHGLDLAIEALVKVRPQIPGVTLDIFGEPNTYLEEILELARQRGVADCLKIHGMVTEHVIARHIMDSDLGLVPNRFSPFIAINLPTRIFEYLAMNRPVVVPATRGIQDYFGPQDLLFFLPNDPASLAEQIVWAYRHPVELAHLTRRGHAIYRRHRWQQEKDRLLTLVSRLLPSPLAIHMAH
ncbi:MAG: glycosyltransferase [Verrucomicrobia bacterium]|nr:glycosyltransferase [Verrucomicrobiota bacterium]